MAIFPQWDFWDKKENVIFQDNITGKSSPTDTYTCI